MVKLVYKCNYDGKVCNKEIPKLDENGIILEPTEINKKIYGNFRTLYMLEKLHRL